MLPCPGAKIGQVMPRGVRTQIAVAFGGDRAESVDTGSKGEQVAKADSTETKRKSRRVIDDMNAGRIEIGQAIEKMRELGLFVEASRIGRWQRVRAQGDS
jgi:hypothetical protein